MRDRSFIRLAIQKSGRLHKKSADLLETCGIHWEMGKSLMSRCKDFPMEIMLVRDDDIPGYVAQGICELGIVGRNELGEQPETNEHITILRELGFGKCRLSLAAPKKLMPLELEWLSGKRIATSYPHLLENFLKEKQIQAKIVTVAGSVELTTSIGLADAICDLVSTGSTLENNGLQEMHPIFQSQAVLIGNKNREHPPQNEICRKLLQRIDGVRKAQKTRYVMMNAPESAVEKICELLPGREKPTILPLHSPGQVAIHAVAYEDVFWNTMEQLKEAGATSLLVVPIEKLID